MNPSRPFFLPTTPNKTAPATNAQPTSEDPEKGFDKSGVMKFCDVKLDFKNLKFIKSLGNGSFGSVGLYSYGSHFLAVKSLDRQIIDHIIQFKREIDILKSTISSPVPFIIEYFGYFFDKVNLRIVLTPVMGSLDRLIEKKGALPNSLIKKCAATIANMENWLIETHNMVHNDIKPGNILLDEFGRISICDFGMCVKLDGIEISNGGTITYRAPELLGVKITASTSQDSWSLGITLLECCNGYHPFEKKTEIEIHAILSSWKPTFLNQPNVLLEELLDGLLKIRPEDRIDMKNAKEYKFISEYRDTPNENVDWIRNGFSE